MGYAHRVEPLSIHSSQSICEESAVLLWPATMALPLFLCKVGVLLRGFSGVGCLIAAPFWDEGGTLV